MAFVREGTTEQTRLVDTLLQIIQSHGDERMQMDAEKLCKELDFAYIKRELPGAALRVEEGFTQVTEIVQAMKSLTRCGMLTKKSGDLNRVVRLAMHQIEPEIQRAAELVMEFGKPSHLPVQRLRYPTDPSKPGREREPLHPREIWAQFQRLDPGEDTSHRRLRRNPRV